MPPGIEPLRALGRAAGRLTKGLLVYPLVGGLGPRTLDLRLGWALAAVGGGGVAAAVVAQGAILRHSPGRDLLAAAWLVAAVSFVGSRRMAGGDRYLALPSALVVLAILAAAIVTNAWRAGGRAEPRIHPRWADGAWTAPLPERQR